MDDAELGPPIEASESLQTMPCNSRALGSPLVVDRWTKDIILSRILKGQLANWDRLPGQKVIAYFWKPTMIEVKDSYGAEMMIKEMIEGSLGVSRVRVLISALENEHRDTWSVFLVSNLTAAVATELVDREFLNTPEETIFIVSYDNTVPTYIMTIDGMHFPGVDTMVNEEVRQRIILVFASEPRFLEMMNGVDMEVPANITDEETARYKIDAVLNSVVVEGIMISSGGRARSLFHLYMHIPSNDMVFFDEFRDWIRKAATFFLAARGLGKCIDWECDNCTSWSHPSPLCPVANMEGFFESPTRCLNRY